jgi:hypothetical protein
VEYGASGFVKSSVDDAPPSVCQTKRKALVGPCSGPQPGATGIWGDSGPAKVEHYRNAMFLQACPACRAAWTIPGMIFLFLGHVVIFVPPQRRGGSRSQLAGRPLPGHGEPAIFPRRCGLRQSGDLRVPRIRGLRLCDPAADQPRLARQDRKPAPAPAGRPPPEVRRYYASFPIIRSWSKPRRAVAKVEWHPGELCPRVDLIVTNLARPAERIVGFYNHRGTSEHGSKRTRARSSGPGCYAAPSLPTRCAFSPCPSRTIWGI